MANRDEMLAKLRRDDMIRRLRESDASSETDDKSLLQSGTEAVNDFATNLSNNWIGRTAAEIASYPGAAIQTIGTDSRSKRLAKNCWLRIKLNTLRPLNARQQRPWPAP